MKINLIGNIMGTSGYASHTKQLANALYDLGHEVHLDCPLYQGWELQVSDKELSMIMNPHYDDGHSVAIMLPTQFPLGLSEEQKSFNGFCVWEGDKVPKGFIEHLLSCDKVLVPSKHVQEAIDNTDKDVSKFTKVEIVPHGVDLDLFKPLDKPEVFTFVSNGGWAKGMNDRKGMQFLIKAFCEEFKKEELVELRIKLNPAYFPQGWDLKTELDKLDLPKDKPRLWISTNAVEYKSMPNFYQGHCFVSPTMGEAFNIPCAEAMSCGLPVITTGFGGQTDFVNNSNGWLIDYELEEVTTDVMYEGIKWAKPDLKHLRKLMRYAFEHKDECVSKGKLARCDIESFSWKSSAEKLVKVLKK